MKSLESPEFGFQSNLFALIRLIILKMVYRVDYKSLYAFECASLCSSSESMLKLSFVICTTLSTPGFLIIDSICLDRYLLIENVMQLGFEVNILTWGLEVFFLLFCQSSLLPHFMSIQIYAHPVKASKQNSKNRMEATLIFKLAQLKQF